MMWIPSISSPPDRNDQAIAEILFLSTVIDVSLQNAAEYSVAFFSSEGSSFVTCNLIVDTKGLITPNIKDWEVQLHGGGEIYRESLPASSRSMHSL